MLALHYVVDGRLCGLSDLLVSRHGQGFTEGDGGLAMSIHVSDSQTSKTAACLLILNEPIEALLNHLFVLATVVSFAGAQERKQRKRRSRRVAWGTRAATRAVTAIRPAELIQGPFAGRILIVCQPLEDPIDSRLTLRTASFALDELISVVGGAVTEHPTSFADSWTFIDIGFRQPTDCEHARGQGRIRLFGGRRLVVGLVGFGRCFGRRSVRHALVAGGVLRLVSISAVVLFGLDGCGNVALVLGNWRGISIFSLDVSSPGVLLIRA